MGRQCSTYVVSADLEAMRQAGALGAVAAPWFVYLGQATGAAFVPFVVFGSLCIMTGFAMPALPETMGAPAAANVQVSMLTISSMHVAVLHRVLLCLCKSYCLLT